MRLFSVLPTEYNIYICTDIYVYIYVCIYVCVGGLDLPPALLLAPLAACSSHDWLATSKTGILFFAPGGGSAAALAIHRLDAY